MDVSKESGIVWVKGAPGDYPYLRETQVDATPRSRSVRPWGETVVAYATLQPELNRVCSRGACGSFGLVIPILANEIIRITRTHAQWKL